MPIQASCLTIPQGENFIFLTDKDTEVAETFSRESSALHIHLLWLTDLLVALNNKMEDPFTRRTIQPIVDLVLEHQRWVQALMSDSLATDSLATQYGASWT